MGERAFHAEQELGRISAFFPILPLLGNQWAATRPWEGLTVGLNLHLTTLTAALVRELQLGGGRWVVSAASPSTTDSAAAQLLRQTGIEVYTPGREDRHMQLLDHEPDILVDVGFDLLAALLDRRPELVDRVRYAVEVTRSGVTEMRRRKNLPFPIVNINDGRLKDAVENRHGVGQAVWQAVTRLTGMHLAGRRLVVVGYGAVGQGLAAYGRAAGTGVEVVESDPVRRLFAHYDGYPTPTLPEALAHASIVVTSTGSARAVTLEHLRGARDGVVLVNAGHGGDEIEVDAIKRAAVSEDNVADQVVSYRLENGRAVTVLGGGHPLNIVLNAGSPEPVLLHFAVLGLTLEWLASTPALAPGEVLVPSEIESRAAEHAMRALTLSGPR